jgi:MerR family redox-sensitive transcriptional activator SoxR
MAAATDPLDETLTIGQLAERTGLPASTIRYYERRGLIPPPARTGGWRRYERSAVEALALIEVSKQAGFTLTEIRRLMSGFEPATPPSARWNAMAQDKLKELDELARRIDAMRALLRRGLECGCLTAEDCKLLQPLV